jgi:predicted transcriptional regulator
MTKLFEQAVEAISVLPDDLQDELAHALLQLAGVDQPLVELTPEEEAAIEESIAQTDRGEFASEEEIRAIWAKHGL